MKKLLSIVICVLFGVTSLWADSETKLSLKVSPEEAGNAALYGIDYNYATSHKKGSILSRWYYYTDWSRDKTNPINTTTSTSETVSSWSTNGVRYKDDKNAYRYANAEADVVILGANVGYAFDKWEVSSSDIDASKVSYKTGCQNVDDWFTFAASTAEASEVTIDFGAQTLSQACSATVTANFRKIITPRQSVIDWTKPAGQQAEIKTTVGLFKATYFKVSNITHNQGDETRTFSCSPAVSEVVNNPGDNIELTLVAGTDVQDGDQFIITLQADNGASETITVNIKSKITVKFIHPTVGKGSFEAVRTNSDKGVSCNISHESADITKEFTKTEDFYHTFTATPATGYRFYRWMINGSESSVLTTVSGGYTLKDGDQITAEFLPKDMAMFVVKNGDGTQYFKLDDAIAAAKNSTSKTVVVAQSGTLYTEYKTLTNEYTSEHGAKYEFTIPAGITLLVPGDAEYTVTEKLSDKSSIIGDHTSTPTCLHYLTFPKDTRIITDGIICVFSKISYMMGHNGKPYQYGEIKMGEDTEIILRATSKLTCFGYITGNPENSFVEARNGATVYETFQIEDFRGGTISSNMPNNNYRVFPLGQYYVQSIETKLILQYGATEYACTCIAMTNPLSILGGEKYLKFPMNIPFIKVSTGGTTEEGFLCLRENTQVEKWYDYTYDKQMYYIKGINEGAKVNFGNMVMDLSVEVESQDYVLPITNNIDITIENVQVTSWYDMAMLAGASLKIMEDAEFVVNGEIFVYDKEVHTTSFHYPLGEYFHPIDYTAYHKKKPGIRKWEDVEDAKIIVDGKISIQESNSDLHGTGFYTTGSSESVATYGANITSNGGGAVMYGVLGTDLYTYQYEQNDDKYENTDYFAIPVTNARLRNGDGTWSAGSEAIAGEEYIYSTNRQKWVTPKDGVSFGAIANNTFLITLPNQDNPTQNVELGVTTEDVMRIEDFEITWPNNAYFIKGDDATYDQANKKIIMPITYKIQKTHNYGSTPNEYVGELVVSCTYSTEDGVDHTETATIDLSAVENYTPDFTVKIEEKDVTSNGTYAFEETVFGQASEASLTITPTENNVAGLQEGVEWSIVPSPNPPFSVADSKVIYTPNPAAKNTGILTIQAIYTDAGNNPIPSKMVSVTLNGTARKKNASLDFKEDLDGTTIYQADVIEKIFKDIGNGENNIEFSYKYENGNDASELVEIKFDEESKNYTLIAKLTDYVNDRTLIITAKQPDTPIQYGTTKEVTITIKPVVTWNWSNLHFGKTYNSPVTLSREGDWSLTLTSVDKINDEALVSLSGSTPDYIATVGVGEGDQVYSAEFTFEQNEQSKIFKSNIFADPRALGFCVNYDYQFEGVSTNSTVTFIEKDGENLAATTFKPGDKWEINMTGIPKTLHFSASGNNDWYVAERPNTSTSYRPIINWTQLAGEQVIQLQPTTNQIMIQYGLAEASNGTISGLCIDELEVASNQDVVYFPIYKNGDATTKKIIYSHTIPQIEFDIDENSGFTISKSDPEEIPTGDENEQYYQTTVTIIDGEENDEQRVAIGKYTLTATQNDIDLEIPIYAAEVPQGLPIHLGTDDLNRYHFIVDRSNYVSWDAQNRNVVFQNPGNDVTRSVTFRFEGAPSRLSFNSLQTLGWQIYESATGAVNDFKQCLEYSVDGTNVTYQLHYTTRYVRLDYYSDDRREITLSNLTIEGDPMLLVNPDELEFSDEEGMKSKELTLTTINLKKIKVVLDNEIDFKITHAKAQTESNEYLLTADQYSDALGTNKVGDIVIKADWVSTSLANDGVITIYNVLEDNSEVVLTKVKLVAAGKYIRLDNANKTGIYTGIPDGTRDLDGDDIPNTEYKYTYHGKDYNENNASPYAYHEVNLTNAFAPDGTALFDYMFVYGETTTKEGQGTNITAPNSETESGSNARTPLLVYARDVDANGIFDRYRHIKTIDDINVGTKPHIERVTISGNEMSEDENKEQIQVPVNYIPVPEEGQLSVYITGFAPYATTGYTKGDEGVFFFRGHAGSKLHVYLEDAHIFARNKMESGQPFYTRGDKRNPTFSEKYARGSGGVLVFECVTETEQIDYATPFEVSIHTIGNNLLKSNYGCFNYFFGMDPFQISAPVHVRLHSANHVRMSKTTLNFDDIWPTKLDETGQITESKRTNGFLGLKKLNNNAPSIDLGNPYTTVNFNGGQVQLQNAQIVSTNYKTTLAISYRSGEYGGDKVGLKFAYGIGTDSVGGTVNFYDGTITIEPMWVKEEYKNYYFIDKDKNGDEIKKQVGTITNGDQTLPVYEYQTTCLRCPKNTNVYGGSICWLRACQHVTSKGGAPSGGGGIDVGQYIYTFNSETDEKDENTQLIKSIQFPDGITTASGDKLEDYLALYNYPNDQYGMNSITPDADDKLYFWIPEGYGGVSAEKDKFLTTWKACMTEISAGMQGITGTVGGNTAVEKNEEIKYMLYCQIDQNISNVITAGEGEGDKKIYSYSAPVKVPDVAQAFYGSEYTSIPPTSVGDELQNEVISENPYEVTDKVYYITTATADVWQTFTAPFDVAKIWVVETYSEAELERMGKIAAQEGKIPRDSVMLAQAKHNADFAAFFGVAMAIGTSNPLETIFNDFKEWGMIQDSKTTDDKGNSITPLYAGTSAYTLRDRYQLVPYNGSNWNKANFYLNHNAADWEIDEEGEREFNVHWELPDVSDDGVPEGGILMRKGETYSMLFPYCTGCFDENFERDFWDYWSGKFLIFESVDYSKESDKVHIIEGSDYIKEDWTAEELETLKPEGIFTSNLPEEGTIKVTGNSTFSFMETFKEDVYIYSPDPMGEWFKVNQIFDDKTNEYVPVTTATKILPTESFLWANISTYKGMPARGVKRTGEIIYPDVPDDDDNNGNQNGTSGHMPTVGGGNDLFITSIAGGINVAVAAPQNVRVLSSTGAVIYSGYIQTAVDVKLPTNGIYIVSGENEVQKILY